MYICNLVFGLEILMPGILLGLKFQACGLFLGLQYEAPSNPPVMYTSRTMRDDDFNSRLAPLAYAFGRGLSDGGQQRRFLSDH